MSEEKRAREEEVFEQELSPDELEASGGDFNIYGHLDDDRGHCVKQFERNIYEGEFPNCAATVEGGSWCWNNDACEKFAVIYIMHSCGRAWK